MSELEDYANSEMAYFDKKRIREQVLKLVDEMCDAAWKHGRFDTEADKADWDRLEKLKKLLAQLSE